jgi:hypothetical protein
MATLDGTQLFTAVPTSGAAFLLNKPVKQPLCLELPDGWTVALSGHYAIARKPEKLAGYKETRDAAYTAAQQGLDLFSLERAANKGIRDAETEHLTWWPEPCGQVLRATYIDLFGMEANAKVVIQRADGTEPPPRPLPRWHESARLYRLSQVAADLFDAYRNLYLALESILDLVRPQNVPGSPLDPEGVWFRRALADAHARVNLTQFAPRGSVDVVADLYQDIYKDTRNMMFHAKASRSSFLPQRSESEKIAVREAVVKLAHVYRRIAAHELGSSSGASFVSPSVLDPARERLKANLRVRASGGDVISEGTIIDLVTRPAPEVEDPYTIAFVGSAGAEQLGSLSRLGGFAAQVDAAAPLLGCRIDGTLTLEGIDRLEAHAALRMVNTGQPRHHFAS